MREKQWYASACLHKDFIDVCPTSGYGLLINDRRSALVLDPSCPDAELGEAVLKSLDASRQMAPEEFYAFQEQFDKGDWYGNWVRDRMERFGYKRKGQLFRGQSRCGIARKAGLIVISPSDHDRLEGWGPLDKSEDVTIPADSSPAEIGAALRLGFSRCRGKY